MPWVAIVSAAIMWIILLFLFTGGFFFVGTVISCFTIRGETRRVNARRARRAARFA